MRTSDKSIVKFVTAQKLEQRPDIMYSDFSSSIIYSKSSSRLSLVDLGSRLGGTTSDFLLSYEQFGLSAGDVSRISGFYDVSPWLINPPTEQNGLSVLDTERTHNRWMAFSRANKESEDDEGRDRRVLVTFDDREFYPRAVILDPSTSKFTRVEKELDESLQVFLESVDRYLTKKRRAKIHVPESQLESKGVLRKERLDRLRDAGFPGGALVMQSIVIVPDNFPEVSTNVIPATFASYVLAGKEPSEERLNEVINKGLSCMRDTFEEEFNLNDTMPTDIMGSVDIDLLEESIRRKMTNEDIYENTWVRFKSRMTGEFVPLDPPTQRFADNPTKDLVEVVAVQAYYFFLCVDRRGDVFVEKFWGDIQPAESAAKRRRTRINIKSKRFNLTSVRPPLKRRFKDSWLKIPSHRDGNGGLRQCLAAMCDAINDVPYGVIHPNDHLIQANRTIWLCAKQDTLSHNVLDKLRTNPPIISSKDSLIDWMRAFSSSLGERINVEER